MKIVTQSAGAHSINATRLAAVLAVVEILDPCVVLTVVPILVNAHSKITRAAIINISELFLVANVVKVSGWSES